MHNKCNFMSTPTSTQTLYEQLGGQAAVEAAVDSFYRKVLADDRVNKFFETTDMEKQIAKQKAFLTMAFGGPHNYTGIELLGKTLRELGVAENLIGQVAAIAESTRADVLNR